AGQGHRQARPRPHLPARAEDHVAPRRRIHDVMPPLPEDAGPPIGRRVFLGMLAAGAAGIVWGAKASDAISHLLRPVTERDVTGLSDLLPTAGRFRFYSVVGSSPHRSDAEYRLKVGGLVDKPLSLTLADLQN